MNNKFVRLIFKNMPAVYLGAAFLLGIGYSFFWGKTIVVQEDHVTGGRYNALVIIIGALILASFFFVGYKLIKKINSDKALRTISFLLIAVFALLLLLFCFLLRMEIVSDLAAIHHAAVSYVETGEWAQQNYYSLYPFQKNWLAVVTLIYKIENMLGISDYRVLPTAFNVIMMVISAFLAYKIAEKLLGLKASVMLLALIVLTPQNYTFCIYYYTFVPGLFFTMIVIFLSLYDNLYCRILLGVFAAIGYEMRATVGIAFVAVLLYVLFKHEKGFVKSVLLMFLGFAVGYGGWTAFMSFVDMPITQLTYAPTHWLVMGMTGDGAYNQDIARFDKSFATKNEMISADLRYIYDYYKENGIGAAFNLWVNKLSLFWGNGVFRVMNKPVTDYNTFWDYTLENKRLFADYYGQMLRVVTLFNAFVSLIRVIKNKMNRLYPVFIFVFGYALFYTFWEGGARYCFPAFIMCQILSVYGFMGVCEKVEEKAPKSRLSFAAVASVLVVMLIAFESVFLVNFSDLTEKNVSIEHISASNELKLRRNKLEREELREGEAVSETFTAHRSFSRLILHVYKTGSSPDNVYLFEILDEDGNEVFKRDFKKDDIKDGRLNVEFDEIEVESNKQFTVRVSVKEKIEGSTCISIEGNKISKDIKETYYNGHADGYGFNQIYFKAYEEVKEKFYPKSFVLGAMALVFIIGLVPTVYFISKSKTAKTV